ncbi:phage holin family protein [Dactylosporangium fulvum]|uniref:Alkaline phosphatase family protein n=1 Tax=Dactylosporangium fulvum TaxID=53359 RepID=A0ABY5W7D4_9ACTN|nr:alkaline phosphatase family protein [Dactylosporangium fulvum]UWP85006.1 alkaline phosphatase family protein [Dactylosporangium fulvum]
MSPSLLRAVATSVVAQRVRFGIRLLQDWRLTVAWGKSLLRSGVTSFVVLAVTFWLLPGVRATGGPAALVELTVLLAVIGTLMRLVLLGVAVVVGGIGVLVVGVMVQALVMFTALSLAEGVSVGSFVDAWIASWLAAVLTALVNWLADAGSEDVFLGQALRQMARRQGDRPATEPGVLVVQLDGLSAPLLSWAVKAGNLPNLGKWLRTGTHSLVPWHTGMPATTPASQAGILHGSEGQIPAFRWYEKENDRLVVTNRPRDAADVEARISTGRGLLADGGASISNVFSGDAPTSLLTFSNAALPGRSARGYLAFVASPYGFARAIVLSVGEMLKEIQQARRQRFRNVYPRVPRTGAYVALRAVTNVLLRDLNVSLISEQMSKGTPVIFCDFVDYDEVAHHAGPLRPEALQTLEGLDRVLGTLHRLTKVAGRRYEIVVLSDHGQSQGSTFSQRHGLTLERLVADLAGGVSCAAKGGTNDEDWGRANTLLAGMSNQTRSCGPVSPPATGEVITVASGNLAMLYLTDVPGKADLEAIDERRPGLVDGLAKHPGIGLVVGESATDGPVAISAEGRHRLRDGAVEGVDPLRPYGPHAAADLLAHQQTAHVGDLVLVSRVDRGTEEVAAFEELVGSHGGIGGWQTEAVLVHPAHWPGPQQPPVGPVAVHRELVRWLDELGLRIPPPVPTPRPGDMSEMSRPV